VGLIPAKRTGKENPKTHSASQKDAVPKRKGHPVWLRLGGTKRRLLEEKDTRRGMVASGKLQKHSTNDLQHESERGVDKESRGPVATMLRRRKKRKKKPLVILGGKRTTNKRKGATIDEVSVERKNKIRGVLGVKRRKKRKGGGVKK